MVPWCQRQGLDKKGRELESWEEDIRTGKLGTVEQPGCP